MTSVKMAPILLVSITEGDERPGASTQKPDRTRRERICRCHGRVSNASHSDANQSLYLIILTQLKPGGRPLTVQNCDNNAMLLAAATGANINTYLRQSTTLIPEVLNNKAGTSSQRVHPVITFTSLSLPFVAKSCFVILFELPRT